jgi:ribosomal protein S18 acetylase RimI-like enzyme
MEFIEYSRNKSDSEQIENHLKECDDFFVPKLSSKVDVSVYAQKLAKHAVNFEAWNTNLLVGLVSVYVNDQHNRLAFISNVSIISTFAGRGIGKALLKECIEYAKNLKFKTVGLEVSVLNARAFNLYTKLGFKEVERKNGIVNLELEMNVIL